VLIVDSKHSKRCPCILLEAALAAQSRHAACFTCDLYCPCCAGPAQQHTSGAHLGLLSQYSVQCSSQSAWQLWPGSLCSWWP
jgi:hypothetical protein